jgi:hypothetical protein
MVLGVDIQTQGDIEGGFMCFNRRCFSGHFDRTAHAPVVQRTPARAVEGVLARFDRNQR